MNKHNIIFVKMLKSLGGETTNNELFMHLSPLYSQLGPLNRYFTDDNCTYHTCIKPLYGPEHEI